MVKEKNSKPVRLDSEFVNELKQFANKNELSMSKASKELMKFFKQNKGMKTKMEIEF